VGYVFVGGDYASAGGFRGFFGEVSFVADAGYVGGVEEEGGGGGGVARVGV